MAEEKETNKEVSKDTNKITPQDIMNKLTSLAETMVNLQTQIDGIKVKEKQVEDAKVEDTISSEEAWESLFK